MRFTRVFVPALAVALLAIGALPAGAATMRQDQPVRAAQTLTQFYILTAANQLVSANSANLEQLGTPVPVSGLVAGDTLVSIDVRPQNGRLYGLGHNAAAGSVTLYHISPSSGVAAPLGPTGSFVQADGVTPLPITGTRFGIDFNPTVDRVRVVNNTGQNFRINPNTGALIDGNFNLPAPPPGTQPDANINGEGATGVDETAYTNNAPNVAATTQYTLDPVVNRLFIQNPPNAGTQTAGRPITLNGAAVDFASVNGFDIPPGVDVAASNTPATGSGFAVVNTGTSVALHRIDLATGAATPLGALNTIAVSGLAVWMPLPIANALTADGLSLQRFRFDQPGTVASAPISGIVAGEALVGIDGRPLTGQLYGLGINDTTNTGTLYLIDPQTGAATAVGAPGQIQFAGVDLPAAAVGYGVDFNPQADRLRVVTNSGLNFRINQITGAPVVPADGQINGLPAGSTGVSATAYTNAFGGTTVTTQYTIDPTSKRLFIQNPPNSGAQTGGLVLNVGGTTLDFTAVNGFDIPPGVNAAAPNAAVSGNAYAALTVGGSTGVYRISLATGATTALGTLGTGATGATGFVVWSEMPQGQRVWLPLITKNVAP